MNPTMIQVERFRRYAADCIAMCAALPAPLRPTLLELAQAWSNLALETERHGRLTSAGSDERPE